MRAMVLDRANTPLVMRQLADPEPGLDQVLIKIRACGVCRTDLHIVDGELTGPKLPVKTEVETFDLADANDALECLRKGNISGAAVLVP